MAKQFTATAILLLADAGKLSLDDPLSQHMKGLPAWSTRVTLKHLLHHTSGIPDYLKLLDDRGHPRSLLTTQKQALSTLTNVEVDFGPGEDWQYSNSNYLLLAEVVKIASGQPLPEFAKTRIFQPLALDMVMDPRAAIPNKARSYRPDTSASAFIPADEPYEQVGDAGVQTTPTQLVRWADNYRTHQVGGVALAQAVLAGAVDTRRGDGVRYGAGIVELPDGSLGHDGSLGGFLTGFWIDKERKTSAAISCNRDQIDTRSMLEAIIGIWSTR